MLWTPNQARRLRSDDHWLICFTSKAILLLALLLSFPALATNEWAYSDYWGVSGWRQLPNIPTVELKIEKLTNDRALLSWVFDAPPSNNYTEIVLQTTIDPSVTGGWTTVTNPTLYFPTTSGVYRFVEVRMSDSQRFFRLAGIETNYFPVFSFAIFHDGQLEFTQTAPLQIRGKTGSGRERCQPFQVLRGFSGHQARRKHNSCAA